MTCMGQDTRHGLRHSGSAGAARCAREGTRAHGVACTRTQPRLHASAPPPAPPAPSFARLDKAGQQAVQCQQHLGARCQQEVQHSDQGALRRGQASARWWRGRRCRLTVASLTPPCCRCHAVCRCRLADASSRLPVSQNSCLGRLRAEGVFETPVGVRGAAAAAAAAADRWPQQAAGEALVCTSSD